MVRQTMAPKRTTRASSTAANSPQPKSASQPEPQLPQTRSRTGANRKRRHSADSELSQEPSRPIKKSSTTTKTPAKRGRPRKSTPVPETVIEEDVDDDIGDEVTVSPAKTGPTCGGLKISEIETLDADLEDESDEESVQLPQSTSTKHVRFGVDNDENSPAIEKSSATFITPHPRTKMSIKRRRTASPSDESSVKRIKSTRTSLPQSLSQEQPTQIINDFRFSPYKTVLNERIKRLSSLRKEADVVFEDPSSDNMLVLDGTHEFSVGQLPMTPITPTINGDHVITKGKAVATSTITPGAHDRAAWTVERKQYQDVITGLRREIDEANTQLQVLNIELDTIGFGDNDASSLDKLQSIREACARAREFLESELPDTLPENVSNEDLLEILVANVKEFADRLRTTDRESNDMAQLVNELTGQVNGLLDRLAKREIDKAELIEESTQLSNSNADKDRDIRDLEAELLTTKQQREDLEAALDRGRIDADNYEAEKAGLEKDVDRLSNSLKQYQAEEAKLISKINTMEKEHRGTVTAMNKEREETVRDLEDRLDKETLEREEVAAIADQRKTVIGELEDRVEAATAERDDLRVSLEAMTEQRDDEKAAREHLGADLDVKNDAINDLETRVQRLDTELDEYTEKLNTLRQLSENERSQRESAERELDSKTISQNDLDKQLREKGKEANELRQKLFEVQTKNAETVQELQKAASERDLQFQDDMAAEVGRREEAEDLAKERASTILDLEQRLEEVEREMRDMIVKKDSDIAELEDRLAQKDAEIQNLDETLQSDQATHDAAVEQHRGKIRELEAGIANLQQTIDKHEDTIHNHERAATDEAEEHAAQLNQRDSQLALLNDQLTELKVEKADLEQERTCLERKVEHEAENMLEMQNESSAQIEHLQRSLLDKQEKIEHVEAKARKVEQEYEGVLTAKDEQIHDLTATTERQAEAIVDLDTKHKNYVRRSLGFITKLQGLVDATKVCADEEGAALEREGEALLGEMMGPPSMAMVPVREKVKGKGKKRREYDSGYGMSLGVVNGGSSSVGGSSGAE